MSGRGIPKYGHGEPYSDILVILNGLFCIVVTMVTTKIIEATYVKELRKQLAEVVLVRSIDPIEYLSS